MIGKFCPLHKGHELLIRTALAQCDQVLPLSYTRPESAHCEPLERRRWFASRFPPERFPGLRGAVLDQADDIPHNDQEEALHRRFCGDQCPARFGCAPDAVFISENCGPGLAVALSAQFGRHRDACAGRSRARAGAGIGHAAASRSLHASRTRLARRLRGAGSAHGRARRRIQRQDHAGAGAGAPDAAGCANEYGRERGVERGGRPDEADLLVLCEPDFDFVQDGTRRDDAFPRRQHAWYLDRIASRGERVLHVHGPLEERLQAVARRLGVELTR